MKKNNLYILKYLVLFTLLFVLYACGGGGGGSSSTDGDTDTPVVGNIGTLSYAPETCSDTDQKDFIYDVMKDVYFWNDQTPVVDPSTYASNSDLLAALRVSPDSWSYNISQQAYNDYYAGSNIGLGVKLTYSSVTNEIFISLVYPSSPAANAGLTRGFELLSVNGYSATDIIQNDLWDDAFGPNENGYVVDLTYIDTSDNTGTTSIVKTSYYAHSAPVYDIFTNATNSNKIGYLTYLAFSSNYRVDLSDAFEAFETNNISELIVDLRYNGGGQNSAANYLGSTIAGTPLIYNIMYAYLHNSRYSAWNRLVGFASSGATLNVDKIVFIVTSQTASASELLINSLTPYKDVILIGSKTHGKPVGMYAFSYCTNYLVPISFQMVNSDGSGGYYDGFSVDCDDSDDLTKQLGDATESMLATAITYLETGGCSRSRANTLNLRNVERTGIDRIFDNR